MPIVYNMVANKFKAMNVEYDTLIFTLQDKTAMPITRKKITVVMISVQLL